MAEQEEDGLLGELLLVEMAIALDMEEMTALNERLAEHRRHRNVINLALRAAEGDLTCVCYTGAEVPANTTERLKQAGKWVVAKIFPSIPSKLFKPLKDDSDKYFRKWV